MPKPLTVSLPTGSMSQEEWDVQGLSFGEASRVSLQVNCLFLVLLPR